MCYIPLMRSCVDFREEKCAMEIVLKWLSLKSNNASVVLFNTPKYNCELIGEGVEYLWDMPKKYHRNTLLSEKDTKEKFEKSARRNLCHVTKKP